MKLNIQFQSTLPRGSDLATKPALVHTFDFNPRSLAGATTGATVVLPAFIHFNPRSLAGATAYASSLISFHAISIHAPSRERLSRPLGICLKPTNFNPRSLAGATLFLPLSYPLFSISIHAPSRERHMDKSLTSNVIAFQSTLPRGSDLV